MTRITRIRAAIALVVGLGAGAAELLAQAKGPESLEQTYGRLCGSGQKGEACAALREALMTRLLGERPNTKAANVETIENKTVELPGHQAVPSGAHSSASTDAGKGPYWGHYLDLLKEPRVFVLEEAWYDLGWESAIATYAWEVPGEAMSVSSTGADGSIKKVATLRWDERRGALVQAQVSGGSESLLVPQADGSFIQESGTVRIIERMYNNGNIEQRTEVKGESGWELVSVYNQMRFSPASIGVLRDLHANAVQVAKLRAKIPRKYFDPAFQRELQERDAARRKANGGFFRSVIGAGLGLAAANAGGMDATQTISAAAKGVALMNPESKVAQAIGASGDAILQNSGVGTAPSGTASTGSSGSAAYPTKPNILNGQPACSMMNETNYRQVGVSGGNDVQLKTMCAQAYEYYSMYKRAIAQGYSEADSNRTFDAHAKSAQVAISFYAGAR